jgi:hypothetical protein
MVYYIVLVLPRPEIPPVPTPVSTPPVVPGEEKWLFKETGIIVSGRFLERWRSDGALPINGYPISMPQTEVSPIDGKLHTVQYFERMAFEYHPEYPEPYDVLPSLLGILEYQKRYGSMGAPGQTASTNNPRIIPETGYTIGDPFRTFWEQHGNVWTMGYPISDEFFELSEMNGLPYRVQYFERAVLEYHPEQAGTDQEVQLSQLGLLRSRYAIGGR